ncbi:hydantoinase/oxoprolinase family protein, partial [Cribrihabitans sp. XS_ASV171]
LGRFMQDHSDRGMAMLDAARTSFEARGVTFELDMAYVGQTHTVSVPVPAQIDGSRVMPPSIAQIEEAFDATYESTFGRLLDNGMRRILNLRSAVTGKRPKFDLATLAPSAADMPAPKAIRPVHFSGKWHETRIYDRLALPVGAEIPGPAILEQPDTTVLVEPGLVGRVDRFGNTIIEPLEMEQ